MMSERTQFFGASFIAQGQRRSGPCRDSGANGLGQLRRGGQRPSDRNGQRERLTRCAAYGGSGRIAQPAIKDEWSLADEGKDDLLGFCQVKSFDGSELPDAGEAGASATREWERRRENRERRVRGRHPRIGGLILRLSEPPQHETSWASGGAGEAQVAASLSRRCEGGAIFLHDRRIPGTRANIDHIALASSGVWVIDAKRYKKATVVIERPVFGQAKLKVGGRDKTKLVESLTRQVEVVKAVVADGDDAVDVHGALCFVEAELPTFRSLTVNGFVIGYPRTIARHIRRGKATADSEKLIAVAHRLDHHFPSA